MLKEFQLNVHYARDAEMAGYDKNCTVQDNLIQAVSDSKGNLQMLQWKANSEPYYVKLAVPVSELPEGYGRYATH